MNEQIAKNQNNAKIDDSHQSHSVNQANQITEIHPPIFKLINDCWEKIFDWLSLQELHSFGQTCKHFQRVTGEYFKWKYKNVTCHVYYNEISIEWNKMNGFIPFAQKLSFYDREPEASFRYAVANVKIPKCMEIVNVRSLECDLKFMENILSSIEVVKFDNIYLEGEFFDAFLMLCVNLKRLSISTNPGKNWLLHEYPTLQYLKLTECDSFGNDDLALFFIRNRNVRSFSTTEKILMQHWNSFIANKIELDDLTILRVDDIYALSVAVNELYRRGFYKHLHFKTKSSECLTELPGLVTLHIDTYDYIKIPALHSVTELVFQALWNGLCSWMEMDEVSMDLKNLERIFTPETSAEYMWPFIRNSKKLKEIKMEYLRDDIDVAAMNSERMKLEHAHKVTIYVEEKNYLAIKKKYNRSDFGLIELKRKESYEGVWDHTFGYF